MGAVALAMTVMHPDMVDRLVLMGSTGVRFPITEGLNDVWGYEPSVTDMKTVFLKFALQRSSFTDERIE